MSRVIKQISDLLWEKFHCLPSFSSNLCALWKSICPSLLLHALNPCTSPSFSSFSLHLCPSFLPVLQMRGTGVQFSDCAWVLYARMVEISGTGVEIQDCAWVPCAWVVATIWDLKWVLFVICCFVLFSFYIIYIYIYAIYLTTPYSFPQTMDINISNKQLIRVHKWVDLKREISYKRLGNIKNELNL